MKVSGAYASLLRGVSQQSPEVRQPGQHTEQVNLLADPVGGLTRRRGTHRLKRTALANPTAPLPGMLSAGQGYRVHTHISQDKEYVVLVREALVDAGYAYGSTSRPPAVICYNRTDNVFVPLNHLDTATTDVDTLIGRFGVQAITSVGKMLVFAINGRAISTTPVAQWNTAATSRIVVWIRGGAYDRTYKVRFGTTGQEASYTTPAAGVAGAATAISPQNIAAQLAGGGTGIGPVTSFGVAVEGAFLFIDSKQDISVSDGGDGSLIRGIYNVTDDVSKLPLMAVNGMIVKIITGPDTSYYVQAVTKTTTNPWINETRWIECAGTIQGGAVSQFYCGVIESASLRMAGSPGSLVGTAIPQIVPSTAGDLTTNPAPGFLQGRQITYLGMFQDRLVVAAGAAVAVSAAGDYFNFFRSTVVTVPLKDPFEMIAQGGEDDFLRYSVAYSRNLVLFGDKRQYVISGQQALTPTSANMSIMTTYADASEVAPVAAGGQIYYARNREGNVALHQIQPGTFVDSAESFPASAQISDYIPAPAAQMEIVPGSPSQLLVRSRSAQNSVYVFSYLDQPDGRKQDAWSRWDFNPNLGSLLGLQSTPEGVLLFWLRPHGAGLSIVVDLLPMTASIGEFPFFDSIRPYSDMDADVQASWNVAFNATSDRFLIGGTRAEAPGLIAQYPTEEAKLVVGSPFDSYVEPTAPFLRDQQQLAALTGRTVITKLSLNMRQSSGVKATVTSSGVAKDYTFNARILGSLLNQIGVIPVASSIHTVAIGREVREYTLRLSALRWYPFTLIGMEWTGQSFNRTPRA